MKIKRIFLPIILLTLPLSACDLFSPKIIHDGTDDYDIDITDDITDDTDKDDEPTDLDEATDDEGEIETPSQEGYDSFDDGILDKNGGKYYLKGEYSKIWISAKKGSELYVYLDGATITSVEGIAFGSEKQVTLHVILLNNSINTIKNNYTVSDTLEEANAFHVKGDVYISGSGTLNAESNVKSAIKVSKNLYILGESVSVNATGLSHAITAQSVSVSKATLNLSSSEKDGINTECEDDTTAFTAEQGFVKLEDAKTTIDVYGDGIQAATTVEISGGTTNITTHGEFVAYSASLITSGDYVKDDFKFIKSGSSYKRVASDEVRSLSSSYYALSSSVKGIKAGPIEYEDESGNEVEVTTGDYLIEINHLANVTINSTDDCIHTNYGDVVLNSCNLNLDSFDDGVHADYDLTVNNCSIGINSSYEGLEGACVVVDGENTNIVSVSSDDGINAASDYSSTNNITINNGYLRVYASGDGLDANDNLIINGGTVIVEGPGNNNGSLDAESVQIKGGIVFACSTGGMQEKTTCTQNAFLYQGNTMSANSVITIANSDKQALFTYTLKQSCNQIIFSSPELVLNSKYLILNGSSTLATISLTSTYTKVGSTGGSGGGRGPGGGGWH